MADTPKLPDHEVLPSGKTIIRHFNEDGSLREEIQMHGLIDIGITRRFRNAEITSEDYFSKNRMVSRKSYEKARCNYPDMPAADTSIKDIGADLLRMVRLQQHQNKEDAEKRFRESTASRFPKPDSTNWIRVTAGRKSHLVIFESHDWKLLSRESSIPSGRYWMQEFGFSGPPGGGASVHKGVQVGFEVTSNRLDTLEVSKKLLDEVLAYVKNPPEISQWQGSIRPRPKPRKKPAPAWPTVLPPLIEFLSGLTEPKVQIFNHHR